MAVIRVLHLNNFPTDKLDAHIDISGNSVKLSYWRLIERDSERTCEVKEIALTFKELDSIYKAIYGP